MEHGIPIIPFYDNKNDQELLKLSIYLKKLVNDDIQETNKKTFKLHTLQEVDAIEDAVDRYLDKS